MLQKKIGILFLVLFAVSCCSSKLAQKNNEAKEVKQEVSIENTKDQKVVFFDYNSSDIRSDALASLEKEVLPWLNEDKGLRVKIEGHCDERGSVAFNKKLGEKRAKAVKTYLVNHGIKASRISTISYGESRPADKGHDEKAWAKNRRAVTISVKI